MAEPSDGRSQLSYYAELSQVGVEMAAPIAIGAILDSYFGISPWLVVIGTLAGFGGSMFHLLKIVGRQGTAKRRDGDSPSGSPDDSKGTKQ